MRETFDATYGPLVGWTTRLVGDPDVAHDLVTEAFAQLLRGRGRGRLDAPHDWLYACVAGLVRDHWRGEPDSRPVRPPLRRAPATAAGSPQDPELSGERPALQRVVQQLPDRCQQTALLHFYAGLPVERIAAATGRSASAVERELSDAERLLADALAEVP